MGLLSVAYRNFRPGCALAFLAAWAIQNYAKGYPMTRTSAIYEVPDCPELALREEVTLEAWIRPRRLPRGGGRILDKSVPGTNRGFMLDTYPGNSLRMVTANGHCTFAARLPANVWTYVAGVYSAPRRIFKLYINGREVAARTDGAFPELSITDVPLRLGADPHDGNRFLGNIRRAAVYARALTAAEIAARFRGGPAPKGVLGDWRLPDRPGRRIPPLAGTLQLFRSGPEEFAGQAPPPSEPLCLWYRRPAARWVEALPVGNGRLGAMVFGRVRRERIQMNQDTIWAGPPVPQDVPGAAQAVAEARRLLFQGKFHEAEQIVATRVLGKRISPRSYQPLGDLWVDSEPAGEIRDYRRDLDLDAGVARVRFQEGEVAHRRAVFASAVDGVLVFHWQADRPGNVRGRFRLSRPQAETFKVGAGEIGLRGRAAHGKRHKGVRFECRARILAQGGTLRTYADGSISVAHADAVTLIVAAATDYNPADPSRPLQRDLGAACDTVLDAACRKSFDRLLADSIADHRKLFRRVAFTLAGDPALRRLPTDERLERLRHGKADPELTTLYFQFGRYLLIGSSRPGDMPANLQGLWNEHMAAPWNADYHININLQMNYWPADVTALPECHEPFFTLVERLLPSANRTARNMFGCGGACAGHGTDAWLWTTPNGHPLWGMWVMGLAWCSRQFMDHYRFYPDRTFLEKHAFPLLRQCAQFFLDWLVPDPKTGKLVSGPDTSPENSFIAPDGSHCSISMGCSMDQEIVWQVFHDYLQAAAILHANDALVRRVRQALERLAVPAVGPDGRLQEWAEPFGEPEPGHRHMSHLFGVHPGCEFTWETTPEKMRAARKSLEYRLAHGGGHTGWSRAWIINFWARLHDGEKAWQNLQALLRRSTLPNLFDTHPPFQIDGNFGGTAGIAEMLLQSHDRAIEILPALPKEWNDGEVRGLRARGGFIVDIRWSRSGPIRVRLTSTAGRPCRIRCRGKVRELELPAGESAEITFPIPE